MKSILFIGAGSFLGGTLRYLVSYFVQSKSYSSFPFGTLTVNLAGCFFIGFVYALSNQGVISQNWRLFIATGILGGFTTFSAFSNETYGMLRDGQFAFASLYVLGSVVLGLLCTFLGFIILKSF